MRAVYFPWNARVAANSTCVENRRFPPEFPHLRIAGTRVMAQVNYKHMMPMRTHKQTIYIYHGKQTLRFSLS